MADTRTEAMTEEKYWTPTPEGFVRATERMLETYGERVNRYELCRNYLDEPVYALRIGRGTRNVVFLGCVHGHEPAGTCGLMALMDGLLGGKVPGSDDSFDPAPMLLNEFSIECVPMANPDGARRFAAQVPDSYPGLTFTNDPEDVERMARIHSEPGHTLGKLRPPHYTPQEVMEWRMTGKPMGTLFTEEGVELWRDWAHGRSMQMVALRELLRLREPELFVDVHQHQIGSRIFLPSGLRAHGDRRKHERLAEAAYDALEAAGIAFTRRVTPYIQDRPDLECSTNWAYMRLGSLQFLLEVDWGYRWASFGHEGSDLPVLTKAEIVMTVWHVLTAFMLTL